MQALGREIGQCSLAQSEGFCPLTLICACITASEAMVEGYRRSLSLKTTAGQYLSRRLMGGDRRRSKRRRADGDRDCLLARFLMVGDTSRRFFTLHARCNHTAALLEWQGPQDALAFWWLDSCRADLLMIQQHEMHACRSAVADETAIACDALCGALWPGQLGLCGATQAPREGCYGCQRSILLGGRVLGQPCSTSPCMLKERSVFLTHRTTFIFHALLCCISHRHLQEDSPHLHVRDHDLAIPVTFARQGVQQMKGCNLGV